MLYNAKNGTLTLRAGQMHYLAFGTGKTPLILLPGLGIGLHSIKGLAVPFALMYRAFAREFRVYVFDRIEPLPAEYSTRQMAADQAEAMQLLGLEPAVVVGVSQGGMIAQWLAADHPQKVAKLALVVTCPRLNPTLAEAMAYWMGCARRGDAAELMRDTGRRMYTDAYLKKAGWMFPLVGRLTAPKSYDRFLTLAQACVDHDVFAQLRQITCPTLVMGGELDSTLTGQASREIAAEIAGSRLVMYPDYGHGLYEEAPDFNQRVLMFARG